MPDGEKQKSTVETIFWLVVEGWTLDRIADVLNKDTESGDMPPWKTDMMVHLRQLVRSGDEERFGA